MIETVNVHAAIISSMLLKYRDTHLQKQYNSVMQDILACRLNTNLQAHQSSLGTNINTHTHTENFIVIKSM